MFKLNVFSLITVSLLLASIKLGVDGETFRSPFDLTEEESNEWRLLGPHFENIFDKLEKKVDSDNPKENIKAADELLHSTNYAFFELGKKQKKEILSLLVSLKDIKDECNMNGYKILGKIFIGTLGIRNLAPRIQVILDHYLTEHAIECRPKYKRWFADKVQKVSPDNLNKIEKSLSGLVYSKFYQANEREIPRMHTEMEMFTPSFTLKCAAKARQILVENILEQVKETNSRWEAIRMENKKSQLKEFDNILDEYIFGPCEDFIEHLTDILTPARMDAAIEDPNQVDFIYGNEAFYGAMIHNRYCRALLHDRSELYSILADVWTGQVQSS